MKKLKKILPVLFLFIILVPVFANAAIIPCGGNILDGNGNIIGKQNECGYKDLLKLVNNIIDWIIKISAPISAGVLAWAGFIYMTSGVVDQKKHAIDMMQKVLIGFAVILAAWIIVSTILKALLKDTSTIPIDLSIINLINLYV
jgi:hypothetical protein